MKTLNTVLKVLTALAAVAGAIYVAATYGDKIVAWAKKVLASLPKCPDVTIDVNIDATPEATATEEDFEEATVEEPEEETPAQEPAEPEEEAVEEIPLTPAPNEPVADDQDFAE